MKPEREKNLLSLCFPLKTEKSFWTTSLILSCGRSYCDGDKEPFFLLRLQVLLEPTNDGYDRANAVWGFRQTMPFIRKNDVLRRHAAPLKTLKHLLCLADGNVGVMSTMKNDGRGGQAIQLVNG